MKIIYAVIILGALVLMGCKTKKINSTTTDTTPPQVAPPKQVRDTSNDVLPSGKPFPMLEFSKGMCFGKCPVYNITINSDGNVDYFGKMHVDKMGDHTKRLTRGELASLYTELKAMDLFQYEDEYGGQVMDISPQIITYREGGREKTITCKLNYPKELDELIMKVEKIAVSEIGWKAVGDDSVRPKNNDKVDRTKYDQIIVHTVKDLDVKKWVKDYDSYDLTVKKAISPNGFIWLLGFNNAKVEGRQLVLLLQDDPDIISAELNKNVHLRN